MVFSSKGFSADLAKVLAIKNAAAANSVKDVRSVLGIVTLLEVYTKFQ